MRLSTLALAASAGIAAADRRLCTMDPKRPGWGTYDTLQGDNLRDLAHDFRDDPQAIYTRNQLTTKRDLAAKLTLTVRCPRGCAYDAQSPGRGYYTVVENDEWYSIGLDFREYSHDIAKTNDLDHGKAPPVKQRIGVRCPRSCRRDAALHHLGWYFTAEGDTLEDIAEDFLTSREDILVANEWKDDSQFKPNSNLKVRCADAY